MTNEPIEKRRQGIEQAALVIITSCIISLVMIGCAAWNRGFLDHLLPDNLQRYPAQPTPAAIAAPGTAENQEVTVPKLPSRYQRQYLPFFRAVGKAEADMAGISIAADGRGNLSDETYKSLDEICRLAAELLLVYDDFENKISQQSDPDLLAWGKALRQRFAAVFEQLVMLAGEAYSLDLTGMHEAYLLSDNIPSALDKHGLIDTSKIPEIWQSAVHARGQLVLDLQYGEYYEKLLEWNSALGQVHDLRNSQLQEIPPLNVRMGRLDVNAVKFLETYDLLLNDIEDLSVEFAKYKQSLEHLEHSDRMDKLIADFEDLAQEDHLAGFTEIYRIYAMDKELTHPVYDRLKDHVAWVDEHWPRRRDYYSAVYRKYEMDWVRMWRPDVLE